MFEVVVSREGKVLVLSMRGACDLQMSPELAELITASIANGMLIDEDRPKRSDLHGLHRPSHVDAGEYRHRVGGSGSLDSPRIAFCDARVRDRRAARRTALRGHRQRLPPGGWGCRTDDAMPAIADPTATRCAGGGRPRWSFLPWRAEGRNPYESLSGEVVVRARIQPHGSAHQGRPLGGLRPRLRRSPPRSIRMLASWWPHTLQSMKGRSDMAGASTRRPRNQHLLGMNPLLNVIQEARSLRLRMVG